MCFASFIKRDSIQLCACNVELICFGRKKTYTNRQIDTRREYGNRVPHEVVVKTQENILLRNGLRFEKYDSNVFKQNNGFVIVGEIDRQYWDRIDCSSM